MWREAGLIAAKDVRIEARSKVSTGQIAPFALTVILLFAFALDPDRGVLTRAAAGLFWVAVLLSSVLAVQRSFAIESSGNARDGLRMSGVDPVSIFTGKAAALALQLFVLEVVLAAAVVVLYDVSVQGVATLLATCILATVGIAVSGTVYGALAAGARAKETLLPLLFLPVVAPVLLAAARATESALGTSADPAGTWIRVLAAFAVIYAAVGAIAFGPLMEDS
jgi:heme exporter protein B